MLREPVGHRTAVRSDVDLRATCSLAVCRPIRGKTETHHIETFFRALGGLRARRAVKSAAQGEEIGARALREVREREGKMGGGRKGAHHFLPRACAAARIFWITFSTSGCGSGEGGGKPSASERSYGPMNTPSAIAQEPRWQTYVLARLVGHTPSAWAALEPGRGGEGERGGE